MFFVSINGLHFFYLLIFAGECYSSMIIDENQLSSAHNIQPSIRFRYKKLTNNLPTEINPNS